MFADSPSHSGRSSVSPSRSSALDHRRIVAPGGRPPRRSGCPPDPPRRDRVDDRPVDRDGAAVAVGLGRSVDRGHGRRRRGGFGGIQVQPDIRHSPTFRIPPPDPHPPPSPRSCPYDPADPRLPPRRRSRRRRGRREAAHQQRARGQTGPHAPITTPLLATRSVSFFWPFGAGVVRDVHDPRHPVQPEPHPPTIKEWTIRRLRGLVSPPGTASMPPVSPGSRTRSSPGGR